MGFRTKAWTGRQSRNLLLNVDVRLNLMVDNIFKLIHRTAKVNCVTCCRGNDEIVREFAKLCRVAMLLCTVEEATTDALTSKKNVLPEPVE